MNERAASPALEPPPGEPRFPLMDALRGCAALTIVLGHAYGPSSEQGFLRRFLDNLAGHTGVAVPVFFGLSGFLLFRPFAAAHARGEAGPALRDFWRRRGLRIVPAYWFALTGAALLFGSTYVPGAFGERWWVFYGFGQVYSLTDNFRGLAVAWSLCTEVAFYALLPALAWSARRVGPWPVIGAMFVLGPVVHLLNTMALDNHDAVLYIAKVTYALPGEAAYFAAGMTLAVWSVRGAPAALHRLIERPGLTMLLAAGVYVVASQVFAFSHPVSWLDFRTRVMGTHLAWIVIVLLVLMPAAFDVRPGRVRTVLSGRFLVYCGVVSYGLYLWHVPAGLWVATHWLDDPALYRDKAGSLPVTFVALFVPGMFFATISYYVVELPFLRLKNRRRAKVPA